jgi:hypothetical protein
MCTTATYLIPSSSITDGSVLSSSTTDDPNVHVIAFLYLRPYFITLAGTNSSDWNLLAGLRESRILYEHRDGEPNGSFSSIKLSFLISNTVTTGKVKRKSSRQSFTLPLLALLLLVLNRYAS